MRLWHYKMIPVLPVKHLCSQFRECSAVASMINNNKVNHIIINRVKDYPIEHFYLYCRLVINEMFRRNYKMSPIVLEKLGYNLSIDYTVCEENDILYNGSPIFKNWHNDRYLKQCLYNFQEKYDCGGLTNEQWSKIYNKFKNKINF